MADEVKDVPNQRGTSSGEIGQNPIEMRRTPQCEPDKPVNNKPVQVKDSQGTVDPKVSDSGS
jgi:hypothetical protein